MHKQHPYRPVIPPVPEGVHRSRWSVMIPTYNCSHYLRQTLASVLAQDPGPEVMQIEVVDDCSTQDDPATVVAELGQGRVGFYRQPHNVGHTGNFATCLQRSRGEWVHLLHGDDYIREGFYQKMQQGFEANSEVGAAFCRHIFMDEQGHWQSISQLLQSHSGVLDRWLERIVAKQYVQTPSIVVRRSVYEMLGGFDRRLSWYEDWEMWVRIATRYVVWYEPEPLAAYRLRSTSNSGRYIRTGANVQDVRRGLEIVQSYLSDYLPSAIATQWLNKNRDHSALCALETAQQLLHQGDLHSGIMQIKEALKCSIAPPVMQQALKLMLIYSPHQLLRHMLGHNKRPRGI
jgi:glycosyltransferase involved in cell wall biosynthesis